MPKYKLSQEERQRRISEGLKRHHANKAKTFEPARNLLIEALNLVPDGTPNEFSHLLEALNYFLKTKGVKQITPEELDAARPSAKTTAKGESMQKEYTPSDKLKKQIENNFVYHPPTPDQNPRFEEIRRYAKGFAEFIASLTPESREQSLAFTHLEEVVMWANASIARNEKP